MTISISPQTQKLLEDQMEKGQFSDPEDVLHLALQSLGQTQGDEYDNLDAETRAAIEESEAQYQHGDAIPWEDVRKELRTRFIDK